MAEAELLRCSTCDEPCAGDELVCRQCSESRLRAIDEADAESVVRARSSGGHGLEAALAAVLRHTTEKPHSFEVSVDAILGGPGRVTVRVVLAPEGPATPIQDVWGEPEALSEETELGPDERAARLGWVVRRTEELDLAEPCVDERYRLGLRDAAVDCETVPLLLGARLKSATLFLEGFAVGEVVVDVHERSTRCTAVFHHPRGRELKVELYAVEDADSAVVDELVRFAERNNEPPTI